MNSHSVSSAQCAPTCSTPVAHRVEFESEFEFEFLKIFEFEFELGTAE